MFPNENPEATVASLLTPTEAAGVLRLPLASIHRLARQGRLPVVRVGRLVRFDPEALQRFIADGGQALPGGWRKDV